MFTSPLCRTRATSLKPPSSLFLRIVASRLMSTAAGINPLIFLSTLPSPPVISGQRHLAEINQDLVKVTQAIDKVEAKIDKVEAKIEKVENEMLQCAKGSDDYVRLEREEDMLGREKDRLGQMELLLMREELLLMQEKAKAASVAIPRIPQDIPFSQDIDFCCSAIQDDKPFIDLEDCVRASIEIVKQQCPAKGGFTVRIPYLLVSRLARGGKTTQLKEIFSKLKQQ